MSPRPGSIPAPTRPQAPASCGAATLVTVLMLLLIAALVAVYASRAQILEQHIATRHERAGLAFEVADAGLEWTLATLNGDLADCAADARGAAWRDRLLRGADALPGPSRGAAAAAPVIAASCTRPADDAWRCRCATDGGDPGDAAPTPTVGAGLAPGFRVALRRADGPDGPPHRAARTGPWRVDAYGCSDAAACASGAAAPPEHDAVHARLSVALLGALRQVPAAPLIVRGRVGGALAGLGLHNTSPASAGLLLVSGGPLPAAAPAHLDSLPGTAAWQVLIGDDAGLAGPAEALFRRLFGMTPEAYRGHPALRILDCRGRCGDAVHKAWRAGARMLWLRGEVELDAGAELGSDAAPLLAIVDGDARLSGPLRLHGLVYARGDLAWHNGSGTAARLDGALVAEGKADFDGPIDLWYRTAPLQALAAATGSIVRVPGSWIDGDD
ncbi:MAG: hypothetical protein JO224_11620 [Pelomonas sp.]|nr:hypothetical protein [Roseateles sp.]